MEIRCGIDDFVEEFSNRFPQKPVFFWMLPETFRYHDGKGLFTIFFGLGVNDFLELVV